MEKEIKKTLPKKTEKKDLGLSAPLYKQNGEKAGKIKLNAEIFGAKINEALMTQAVKVYLANQRRGTASTKTRGEVSGGGSKPWRQKGLGRARAGSSRTPHWRGGGVVNGPKPKSFTLELPKKMKRKALFSALSSKAKGESIVVVDQISFKEPKTKLAAKMISNLPVKEKNLFIIEGGNRNAQKSLRNLPNIEVKDIQNLNTFEVLNEDILIFTKNVLSKMEELYLKEKSNETR